MQQEFLYWVTLYYGVLNNLYGKDRSDAVKHMNTDEDFDKWLAEFEKKRQLEDQGASTPPSGPSRGGAKQKMAKEDYIKRFNAVVED